MEINFIAVRGQSIPREKPSAAGNAWVKKLKELNEAHKTIQKELQKTREASKLNEVVSKFKSGQKLTPSEMEYLAKHSPELYEKAIRILEERKALERQLRSAKTKQEAAQILQTALHVVEKTGGDEFEVVSKANHFHRAYAEFVAGKEDEDDDNRPVIVKVASPSAPHVPDAVPKIDISI